MRIASRNEWGASPGSLPAKRMTLPATAVYLHHSVTQVSVHPAADMRAIESVGLARFGQFPYSFVVHPDGTILEGCGTRVGAHTAGRNSTSFGICLIGNYQDRAVTVHQLDAVRWLVAHLIGTGKLKPGIYPTGGHRDVKATACPGDKAYRLLDVMRVPWTEHETPTPKEPAMADDPSLPNIEGPLTLHILSDQAGNCTGYAVFGTMTGEIHGHGPGWRYHGRSEDTTPDDQP